MIQDSLAVGLRDHSVLFHSRDNFDLVAVLDDASDTLGDVHIIVSDALPPGYVRMQGMSSVTCSQSDAPILLRELMEQMPHATFTIRLEHASATEGNPPLVRITISG
ncbi:hypothetical protein OBBRIDRAFT_839861 [Obba rivulosa]|uniref:Uncharacterized protein n=1 Tax=Obba rivulosa TaxID=1052685 RepID=A0A8E2AS54_9APHY|nr:hypothetical protein OBBRIDRAFT_839861 [Obba rivulosa]